MREYGSAPIFLTSDAQKQWDELDPKIKENVRKYITIFVDKLGDRMAIETMACVINDMQKEIDELRKEIKGGHT